LAQYSELTNSLKNKKGEPQEKTPDEMWKRVAKAVAVMEKKEVRKKWEKEFYQAMKNFKYVPGGRILAGAGTGYSVTYYNCFVIPSPKDSRGGILDTLKQMVEIMAHGGGVGFNLSSLRPRGMRVEKVNGYSSGPMNWAELFSVATRDIIQQGGTRRGALMLMIWDWHPDLEEFITVKQDLSRILGANLSVCVSDSFMKVFLPTSYASGCSFLGRPILRFTMMVVVSVIPSDSTFPCGTASFLAAYCW
jgi:ribonucleoside-diphosphate reductase alpha chain